MCGSCKKYACDLMDKKLEDLKKERELAKNKINLYFSFLIKID